LPDMSDFMVDWVETRPGRTDRQTGVPPSLYTLTVTDFLQCGQSQWSLTGNISNVQLWKQLMYMDHFKNSMVEIVVTYRGHFKSSKI